MENLFVYTNVAANTREAVFAFLSTKIVEVGKATNEQAVEIGLKQREAEGTTGMMDGFAIPHAKSESIEEPTIIILKLTNAVAWDSLDGQPIKYVIALFIPAAEAGTSHLALLSQMARMLMDEGFKQAFITASTQEEIVGLIDSKLEGMLKKMRKVSEGKYQALVNMSNPDGIIGALAIDQRGALKKMMARHQEEVKVDDLIHFKELVSEELTPFASSILLDPEYGLPAAEKRAKTAGLLLAYEKTGYDTTIPGRLPDTLAFWSAKRLKEAGADGCKFLLYYDVDESEEVNERKQAYVERIGSECLAEDLPFFLELLSYDATIPDTTSKEYAKIKPKKVIEMMKIFSEPRFNVDVLKVEVPVNMTYVEGFGKEIIYSKQEASALFIEQSQATDLPFIFLSAGVSAEGFQETLHFAKNAGSSFNGVLCGRATWADGVAPFVDQGRQAAIKWLAEQGRNNIEKLNGVLRKTASSWQNKISR